MLPSRGVFRGGGHGGSSPSWISEIYVFLGRGERGEASPLQKRKKKCKPLLGKKP